jgi:VanZ family protein
MSTDFSNGTSFNWFSVVISIHDMASRDSFLTVDLKVRGLWLALGWLLVLLVVYLSLAPAPIEFEIEQGDKFSHVIAYLVLMSWFANLYETPRQRLIRATAFVAMGIALEVVQGLVAYRSFEIADMGAGAAGVVLGWILAPPRMPNYLAFAERVWRLYS